MRGWWFLWLALGCLYCAGSDALYDPPGGRSFWARRSEGNNSTTFYRVVAMFSGESAHAVVYTEANRAIAADTVGRILAAFENSIVPIEHSLFAPPTDVDGNGKTILLLLDIQDGYREGSPGYVAGYFDPLNHYRDEVVNAFNKNYHSNHAELLYLDVVQAEPASTSFLATLAHEYQHLLHFSKFFRGEQAEPEPIWLDEGLSEIASDLTGFGPQLSRVNYFANALLASVSLLKNSDTFGLENYAMSYVYFRYLTDVYGQGVASAIFRNNQVGVAGLNNSLAQLDSALTSICGATTGLSYAHFGCSYRFFWGAMIRANVGDSPANTLVRYNGNTVSYLGAAGAFTYRWNTGNTAFTQELTQSLARGAYGPSNGRGVSLVGYAPLLSRIRSAPPDPQFDNCTDCGLTLIAGNDYYVIFNHNAEMASAKTAVVRDSTQTNWSTSITPTRPTNQVLHWHFSLPADGFESLRQD
ncbi:MAG: hypothetical protein N2Z22_06665 [Turneriella sp.]|nr:hypothetical protein [Turneriella sp.]